jgi:hypothetical protein
MAFIVNKDFFFTQLHIPQLTDNAVNTDLEWLIAEYEPKLLENLLGYPLYKLFVAGIIANTQIYKDIRDGKEYTNSRGELVKWKGLSFGEAPLKKSLIANYVYFYWLKKNNSSTTVSGEKTTKTENAEASSPRYKAARAWNDMVEMNKQLRDFLLANLATYPEYIDPLTRYPKNNDRIELFKIMSPYL